MALMVSRFGPRRSISTSISTSKYRSQVGQRAWMRWDAERLPRVSGRNFRSGIFVLHAFRAQGNRGADGKSSRPGALGGELGLPDFTATAQAKAGSPTWP